MELTGQLHAPAALPPWKYYPLDKRLRGPQSQSGRGGEEKNFQPLPGLEPPIIQPVAQLYTVEVSRLLQDSIDGNLFLREDNTENWGETPKSVGRLKPVIIVQEGSRTKRALGRAATGIGSRVLFSTHYYYLTTLLYCIRNCRHPMRSFWRWNIIHMHVVTDAFILCTLCKYA
jgi:hypothetical protein